MVKRNGRLIGENGSNVNQEGSDEASTSSRQTNPTVEDETFPTASWQKLVDQEPDNDDDLADCATQSRSSPRLAGKKTQDYYQERDPGYRFIHLDSVRRTFEEGHKCKNANIIFEEEQAKRYGQSALFALQCSSCKKKTYLQTAKHDGGAWTPQVAMDINKRLVYAACETGIGREGMATICDILNMPQPMSSESWNGHVNSLYDVHKNELQNNLQAARTKLRKKLGHEN